MSKATHVQRPLFGLWLAWEQLPDSVREQALDVLTEIYLETLTVVQFLSDHDLLLGAKTSNEGTRCRQVRLITLTGSDSTANLTDLAQKWRISCRLACSRTPGVPQLSFRRSGPQPPFMGETP
jgi:hypothetical protein